MRGITKSKHLMDVPLSDDQDNLFDEKDDDMDLEFDEVIVYED